MSYDSTNDTNEHIWGVRDDINQFRLNLGIRGFDHDKSKLESPEKELFDKYTPILKTLNYGSKEYFQCLDQLKPALDHHYSVSKHHPQYWDNGVQDMSLLDIVEMLADWHCASKRMDGGSLIKSIEINQKRFDLDKINLTQILINTAKEMKWIP